MKRKYRNCNDISTLTLVNEKIHYLVYATLSNHASDFFIAPNVFSYDRSDGMEVMVDNKFLKANNPLLVIN